MTQGVVDDQVLKIGEAGFWWDRCCTCGLVHLNHVFPDRGRFFHISIGTNGLQNKFASGPSINVKIKNIDIKE